MLISRMLQCISVATALMGIFAADMSGAKETPTGEHNSMSSEFSANPFRDPSKLTLHAPAFDQIKNDDYIPAFEEGIRQQQLELDTIANNPSPATFENTIVAMERSGQLLARVSKAFFNLSQSNTSNQIDSISQHLIPVLTAHQNAITANTKLFARIKTVHDQHAHLGLDPESELLIEKYYEMFVRAGALLDIVDKAKLVALDARLGTLSTAFGKNAVANTAASAVVVDNRSELEGLSEGEIQEASAAAKRRHLDGKYVLSLQNTTTQPILASLMNRALRERVFKASIGRGDSRGTNDNRAMISEIAQLRAQRAGLFGYPSFAAYTLELQMAKTPDIAIAMMLRIAEPAVATAKAEAAKIQKLIDQQASDNNTASFKLQPWDWAFYAKQLQGAGNHFDEYQVEPYFELDRVLNDGVFFAAHELYGLTFKERKDLPVYNSDVRVFEVFDADSKTIALIYFDYFARDNKHGGGWMDSFVDQSDLLNQHAVIVNVASFARPATGRPALLSLEEVVTMFDLFGYGLNGILSNVKYPMFSGASTSLDFVSLSSQFNENWAFEPKVLTHYAKNFRTGEPIPDNLAAKIENSNVHNQGYATIEYIASALIDMSWHQLSIDAPRQNADSFEAATLKKYGLAMDEVPPRYRSTNFQHIWASQYAANYYAYMWTAVLAQDTFAWFTENGGMTRANGEHYRDTVLSRGGTKDAHQLYLDFRGKEPSVEPYLEKKGLKPVAPAASEAK